LDCAISSASSANNWITWFLNRHCRRDEADVAMGAKALFAAIESSTDSELCSAGSNPQMCREQGGSIVFSPRVTASACIYMQLSGKHSL